MWRGFFFISFSVHSLLILFILFFIVSFIVHSLFIHSLFQTTRRAMRIMESLMDEFCERPNEPDLPPPGVWHLMH